MDNGSERGSDSKNNSSTSSSGDSDKAAPSASLVITASAAGLAVLATAALTVWREPLEDLVYGDGLGTAAGWGAGDVAGGLLWAFALYYCSPLQLLLVFLGRFDTERPSDAVLKLIGRSAGLRVDDVDYLRPAWVQAAAVAVFILAGGAMSWGFSAALGDATWAVSSGIGACMAAGLFEVGRPRRLSRDEAVELESQWQDFARFARARLQRTGRCHESEVFGAFRREYARYRDPETVPDLVLRDMVRNWNRDVERTRTGYLKGVSLQPRVDAFTGEVTGYQAAAGARATTANTIGTGDTNGGSQGT